MNSFKCWTVAAGVLKSWVHLSWCLSYKLICFQDFGTSEPESKSELCLDRVCGTRWKKSKESEAEIKLCFWLTGELQSTCVFHGRVFIQQQSFQARVWDTVRKFPRPTGSLQQETFSASSSIIIIKHHQHWFWTKIQTSLGSVSCPRKTRESTWGDNKHRNPQTIWH